MACALWSSGSGPRRGPPLPRRDLGTGAFEKGEGAVSQSAAEAARLQEVALNIELAWDEDLPGVKRAFYVCPKCGRRCRHIYLDYMACRICAKLDYASRHRYRTVPGYNRLLSLRAKIGAELAPFTPLPTLSPQATRKRKIAAEIGELEARLIGHLAGINNALERRIKLRGLK